MPTTNSNDSEFFQRAMAAIRAAWDALTPDQQYEQVSDAVEAIALIIQALPTKALQELSVAMRFESLLGGGNDAAFAAFLAASREVERRLDQDGAPDPAISAVLAHLK